MTDTQTAAPPHPLANAKQRYSQSLRQILTDRMERFQEIAMLSDKHILENILSIWDTTWAGSDTGILSAFETVVRNHTIAVQLTDGCGKILSAEEILQPDHGRLAPGSDPIDHLVKQAMGNEAAQPAKSTSRTAVAFRQLTGHELKDHFERFLTDATDGERALMIELFELREGCTHPSKASPSELPIAFAVDGLLSTNSPMIFRFPEECLPDVRAYDEWRKQATPAEMGVVAGLVKIMQENHWLGGFLRALGWTVRGERGLKGLDPEWVRGEINEAVRDFTDKIDTAREMLAEYPELVKETK